MRSLKALTQPVIAGSRFGNVLHDVRAAAEMCTIGGPLHACTCNCGMNARSEPKSATDRSHVTIDDD